MQHSLGCGRFPCNSLSPFCPNCRTLLYRFVWTPEEARQDNALRQRAAPRDARMGEDLEVENVVVLCTIFVGAALLLLMMPSCRHYQDDFTLARTTKTIPY